MGLPKGGQAAGERRDYPDLDGILAPAGQGKAEAQHKQSCKSQVIHTPPFHAGESMAANYTLPPEQKFTL
jgi:hypothetical protein